MSLALQSPPPNPQARFSRPDPTQRAVYEAVRQSGSCVPSKLASKFYSSHGH